MTQRSSRSQPASQAVSQTTPSALTGRRRFFDRGMNWRIASPRTARAMCSLKQAATSQISQSGVRIPFIAGSIGEDQGGGDNFPVLEA